MMIESRTSGAASIHVSSALFESGNCCNFSTINSLISSPEYCCSISGLSEGPNNLACLEYSLTVVCSSKSASVAK